MKFLDLREETFFRFVINLDHLIYGKKKNIWRLRHNVNNDGTDD